MIPLMEAVLSIKIPDNWVTEITNKYPATIKVLDSLPFEGEGVRDLIEITAPENYLNKVLKEIKEHPMVSYFDVTTTDKEKALAVVSADSCVLCRALTESDCFPSSVSTKEDRTVECTLIISERASLKRLIRNLEKGGCDVKLIRISGIDDKEALTSRQEEIVRLAFEKGYFDYPKKVGIRDLASILNISPSTLSVILRKGEKKILDAYFKKK